MAPGEAPPGAPAPWGRATRRGASRGRAVLILALLLLALAAFFASDTAATLGAAGQAQTTALAVILALAFFRFRPRRRTAALSLAVWGGVAAIAIIAHSHFHEIVDAYDRVVADLLPGSGRTIDAHAVAFTIANDHHYWIDAKANSVGVRFMLDTGASDIVLTKADAKRLGFGLGALSFTQAFNTANGTTRAAPITLDELRIGPIVLTHVRAYVNEGELHQSLLGMAFLARMTSLEIKDDVLTIRR